MPKLKPFCALLYADSFKSQLQQMIAPPYDVISPDGLKALRQRHEFNAVKLSLVDDPEDPDRYRVLKGRFDDFKKRGVFSQPRTPAFYLIEENFSIAGQPRRRIGFVSLMEISDFAEKKVLPHEFTLSGPKKDRFELLREMGAELSQVFFCYKDTELVVEKIFDRLSKATPHFDVPAVDGVSRKLWLIDDSNDIQTVQRLLSEKPVLIADGHHRYETSIAFRDFDKSEKSKFVQGYFTNLEAPGFSIQPIHRLFSLPDAFSVEGFLDRLRQSFEITEMKSIDPEELIKRRNRSQVALFVQFKDTGKILLLSRHSKSDEDAEIFVVQNEILELILGWDVGKASQGLIKYEHELEEFQKTLSKMPRGVGLFLPPTNLDLVMKRALRGERMPQKSTYFYPKIASGLVNYELGNF